MKSKVIVFLGPAGVGKTTQLLLLRRYLQSKNESTFRSYIKSFHPRTLGYIARIAHRGTDSTDIDIPFARRLMRVITYIDLFAVLGVYLFSIKFPSIVGRIVVVEESLPGTVMEYLDANKKGFISKELTNRATNFLYRFINKEKAIAVILLSDMPTLHKRIKKRGFRLEREPYMQSEATAIEKMKDRLGPSTILIDESDKEIREVHDMLIARLSSYLEA